MFLLILILLFFNLNLNEAERKRNVKFFSYDCHYFYVDTYFVVYKIAILFKTVTQHSLNAKCTQQQQQQHEKQYKFTMQILDAHLAAATTGKTKKKSKQKHF